MQDSASVLCPYCGQSFELAVDATVPSQSLVTDCEVCCRPMEIVVECSSGEILSLDARAN